MTEAEWLSCSDPQRLLDCVAGTVSDRKVRLFAVACCRRISHLFGESQFQSRLILGELLADRADTRADRRRGYRTPKGIITSTWLAVAAVVDTPATVAAARASYHAAEAVGEHAGLPPSFRVDGRERRKQAELVREVCGNPYRPIEVDPCWITFTVRALAEGIYADRAFDRLPILADALQDAGCENADILTHLRGDGPHVRGCWALDLILGKE